MLSKAIERSLKGSLGPRFTTDPSALMVYSIDAGMMEGKALGVCFPSNVEDVSRILSLCHHAGIPVYARGAGSGRTGGAVPWRPGIVLSLERMHEIREISSRDLVARVEPGVVTGRLHDVVSCKGLFYPPDPASLSFCTIGGNVATCAGGPRAVKYGVTRDYVLGLEVVTAEGEVLNLGGRTVKSSSGYALERLMCGSEGTLAVFTEITLRLIPSPPCVGVMVACFKAPDDAANAVLDIFSMGITPRTCEFMDGTCSRLVLEGAGLPGCDGGAVGAMLLLESDGNSQGVVRDELKSMGDACMKNNAIYTRIAERGEEGPIWALRRTLSQRVRGLGYPDKVSEDIVVPRGKIPEMVTALQDIERRVGVKILCFGHMGDGNLHVNCLCDLQKERVNVETAIHEIFRHTLKLNGRVSGEHGVGMTKSRYLTWELNPATYRLMRSIKDLMDPGGILNPGKVFEQ